VRQVGYLLEFFRGNLVWKKPLCWKQHFESSGDAPAIWRRDVCCYWSPDYQKRRNKSILCERYELKYSSWWLKKGE